MSIYAVPLEQREWCSLINKKRFGKEQVTQIDKLNLACTI
jgi:hypothetical protein